MRVRTSVPVVIYLCATGGREARAAYSCSNSTCVNSRAGMFQLFEYCSCLFSSTVALSLSLLSSLPTASLFSPSYYRNPAKREKRLQYCTAGRRSPTPSAI